MWIHKLKLLCWKNWIMIKRHPIASTFELILPVAIIAIIAYFYNTIEERTEKSRQFEQFDLSSSSCIESLASKAGIYPKDEVIEDLVKKALLSTFEVEYFDNQIKLSDWLESSNNTAMAIEFSPSFKSSGYKHLKYTIRLPTSQNLWMTERLYSDSKSSRIASYASASYPSEPPYYDECFLHLQNKIDRSFISNSSLPNITMNAYPYPEVTTNHIITVVKMALPLIFVFSMILPVKIVIKNIAIERESALKESMKMVGLSSGIYWASWFIRCFMMLIIPLTLNTILVTISTSFTKGIFPHSNFYLIWFFFMLYAVSVITFGFFVSVIFKKSFVSTSVGALFFVATIFVYNWLSNEFYSYSNFIKALLSMHVNINVGIGVDLLGNRELFNEGINFSNLFEPDVNMKFSFGELLIYMKVGSALTMILIMYIERVFPGQFGIAEPWYFPVNFLIKRFKKPFEEYHELIQVNEGDFEDEPTGLNAGIRIDKMRKTFGSKVAVNNLSLNMFKGQITVLLGKNGAGKTTTMSMLVGLFSPSSGTAYIDGKDIRTEIDEARKSVGICPQHDVLFNDLTVKEHLNFYCTLKGMTDSNLIEQEVQHYTNLLGISEKIDAPSGTLSGGQMRRLSIAIALCGGTKIVILDEPTAGLDPGARRELWNLLIAEKQTRTILLSTHFMDEADVLGDRIAIMNDGALRTVGSSFFLKQKFGTGYRLICVKNQNFNDHDVLEILKKHDEDASVESQGDKEVTFVLDEGNLPVFHNLFKELEDRKNELNISSFGCNLSTFEDVFIRLGNEGQIVKKPLNATNIQIESLKPKKVTGGALLLYQILAILLKKFYIFRRSWKSILFMIIFSICILQLLSTNKNLQKTQQLDISLDDYEQTITLIKDDGGNTDLVEGYKNLFHGKNQVNNITENMVNFSLKIATESLGEFTRKYLIGATFQKDTIIAWFNSQPYHTMPLTINTINRALLQSNNGTSYDISTSNYPYKAKLTENEKKSENSQMQLANTIFSFLGFFILLTYWPFVFTIHYIEERDANLKRMQFVSGMSRYVYWMTSLFFDFLGFALICCALSGYLVTFAKSYFKGSEDFFMLLVISISFGFANFCLSYLCSFVFKKSSTFIGIYSVISIMFVIFVPITSIESIKWSKWVGMLHPSFSLVTELVIAGNHSIIGKRMAGINPDVISPSVYNFEYGLGKSLAMNYISGIIYLTITLLIDLNVFKFLLYKIIKPSKNMPSITNIEDDDVTEEIQKVKKLTDEDIKSRNLVMKGLTKYYKKFLAVNQLYLEVPKRECFGMLGINGAGKTSTFKMMIGDERISAGDVFLGGHSVKSNKAEKLMGYCPQFGGVLPQLTGFETLKIFSLIRGIERSEIADVVDAFAENLGFKEHLMKPIAALSGGNKRKVSTALSLLGDPEVIFLDEPTTGIDPQARRLVWDAVNKARNSGQTVVLTSHSMDECESLCTRIGIMVNGQFKCLGSVQHLKNKYSQGFVLTMKMSRDEDELKNQIEARVKAEFGESTVLKEKYMDILTFHITQANMKWSTMFEVMARMKEEMDIAEYSLNQMSLEQVFMMFASK